MAPKFRYIDFLSSKSAYKRIIHNKCLTSQKTYRHTDIQTHRHTDTHTHTHTHTKPHIEVGDPKGTPLKNVRFIGLGSAN